jgi:cell division protein FtsI/penicillin-binding protein 2
LKIIYQSMFVRRLLLLGGLIALGLLALTARLAVLTVANHDQLRDAAEQRLTREVWTPTVRGGIVDRKGRVLAQDRPSYDIMVDYRTMSGDWAARQARQAALRLAGSRWADLGRDGQQELIATMLPQFEAHVVEGWTLLANTLGLDATELAQRRQDVLDKVQSRHRSIAAARLEKRIDEARAKGEGQGEITERMLRRFERDAQEPIEDMIRAHVLARGVPDAIGFATRRLAGQSINLTLTTGETGEKFALAADRVETIPLFPGLSVQDSGQREYPFDVQTITLDTSLYPSPLRGGQLSFTVQGIASQLLGRLRSQVYPTRTDEKGRVIPGDQERREAFLESQPTLAQRALVQSEAGLTIDRGAYREGDRLGEAGLEASQENWLRGLRGLQRTALETNTTQTTDAAPGRTIQLTLDAQLQARIQGLLAPEAGLAVVQPWQATPASVQLPAGTALHSAVVVLEVDSGDVLAAVSSPTVSRESWERDMATLLRDEEHKPLLNRALAAEYPPGSIVKPLMLLEAQHRGFAQPGESIACTGHYLPNNPNVLRCLIWKNFKFKHDQTLGHSPNPIEAIGVSCNIYFYTMGDRLGPQGVRDVFTKFGVGTPRPFALGAGFEAAGTLGANGPNSISSDDAIQMGIGQGPVTWTVMHAANAYATIARGGRVLAPRIVITDEPREPKDLGYSPTSVREALDGLWYAINMPRGTGHHLGGQLEHELIFTVPGIKVWGKTGTADAPALRVDPDGDGPEEPRVARDGDHSWFVVLAGKDRPQYAIAVLVEYGGSGGKVSGPIANQIIKVLVEEGYL